MYHYMVEVEGQLKKWGNSFAIRISKNKVRENKMKVNEKFKLILMPEKNVLKETFGTGKFRGSTEKLLKQVDKELYND